MAVDEMAGGKRHQQRGNELKQADQPEVPGA